MVTGGEFLPDGKQLVTASRDQTVQFWILPEPMSGPPERVRADMEYLTGMELDERGTVRPLATSAWVKRRPR
jgi:WD40 repeat protein